MVQVGFSFLRSKVGRRILSFFVISALVPVTAFAILAIPRVVELYRDLNESVLRQANTAYATALLGRLVGLDGELAAYRHLADARAGPVEQVVGGHFESVSRVQMDSYQRSAAGASQKLPMLSAAQKAHIRTGKTLLTVERAGEEIELFMVRGLHGAGASGEMLVGSIHPRYLWPDVRSFSDHVQVCVLASADVVLHCSEPAMAPILSRLQSSDKVDGAGKLR